MVCMHVWVTPWWRCFPGAQCLGKDSQRASLFCTEKNACIPHLTSLLPQRFWASLAFAYPKVGKAWGVMNAQCVVSLSLIIKFLILIKTPFTSLGAVKSEFCLNFFMQPLGFSLFACSFPIIPAASAFYLQYMELGVGKDGPYLKVAGKVSVYCLLLLPLCVYL